MAGATPPLVALLRRGSDEGRAKAAGKLKIFARGAVSRVAVAAAGGIPLLVSLLRTAQTWAGRTQKEHY